MQDIGYRIEDTGYRIKDTGYRISGTQERHPGLDPGSLWLWRCLGFSATSLAFKIPACAGMTTKRKIF